MLGGGVVATGTVVTAAAVVLGGALVVAAGVELVAAAAVMHLCLSWPRVSRSLLSPCSLEQSSNKLWTALSTALCNGQIREGPNHFLEDTTTELSTVS